MSESVIGLEQAILGESDTLFHLQSATEIGAAAARLADQTSRKLKLFSFDLDPAIFNQGGFIEAMKQLALQSRVAQIRILLQDNELIRQQPHELIELSRRLTSTIEIRRPAEPFLMPPENFLLADNYGYLQLNMQERYNATSCFKDPLKVTQLANHFDEAWESGTPDIEALRLHL